MVAAAMAAACDNCVAGMGTKPAEDAADAALKYGDPYTYDWGTLRI